MMKVFGYVVHVALGGVSLNGKDENHYEHWNEGLVCPECRPSTPLS
jgi:hypothetical protein